MKLKRLKTLVLTGILATLFTGCSSPVETEPFDITTVDITTHPQAIITMDSGETMTVCLLPEVAPNTVNNFISLAESGFYDGLTFHRVIENFMIQGGDPDGNGLGGPGYAIKGEFSNNGFANGLNHTKGVISMARARDNDTAGSQFFIMHADVATLDGDYAAFGFVTEGLEVVDRIATVPKDKDDKPLEPVVIKSITIERNGYTPEEPITIKK
ncbi:MAG: peptidylprolyl isomerase [Clostridiales bacterium 38-18]|nr:MAG: peptidylprolyl isomerase [Clostridiales bacterium 38-18]